MSAGSDGLFTPGTRVWVPNAQVGWEAGTILSANDAIISVVVDESGQKVTFEVESPLRPELQNPEILVGAEDLTELSYMHEPGVLRTLAVRFTQRKTVYTYCGIVLIAINPYQRQDDLYGQEKIATFGKKDTPFGIVDDADICEPHVYAVAKAAMEKLQRTNKSQSVIVSGESGAGKTVSAKEAMRYFAQVGGADVETSIEAKVLSSNPIMECFGNAKTTRNDNSSRFGKYIAMYFGTAGRSILGAQMRTYLLEKSRVVYQAEIERNYHIFYSLCACADDPRFENLLLNSAESFHYTNQGGAADVDSIDDKTNLHEIMECMERLGISTESQIELFGVMSAILHLGNIDIGGGERATVAPDDPHCEAAAELFGLPTPALVKAITQKLVIAGKEKIDKPLSREEAGYARDALAKHVYSHVFDWIVAVVNDSLASSETSIGSFIGVLDIYGFETFPVNSYEQFCINYANEKLQNQFNDYVFGLEQAMYQSEGIDWSWVDFYDNSPCLSLIEERKDFPGIFALLDDECRKNKGTDENFALAMHESLGSNAFFAKPGVHDGGEMAFIVKHYAVDVCYQVEGFLQKNKDSIAEDHMAMLMSSELPAMTKIFAKAKRASVEAQKNSSRRSLRRKDIEQKTVGTMFQDSLAELMSDLNGTDPHYIRCIKPNDDKKPFTFDNLRVIEQLRACGILETMRISAAGYPGRYLFAEFLERFKMLGPKNLTARAKAVSTMYSVPRLALTSSDLEFYEALWEFAPTVDGFLEAEDAVELFMLSHLDEDEHLSKVWSKAKEEGDHTRMDALTKREFMTAIKYVALAQDCQEIEERNLSQRTMIPDFGPGIPPTKSDLVEAAAPRRASVGVRRQVPPSELANHEITMCKLVLDHLYSKAPVGDASDLFQIGKAKVFFRAGQVAYLEKLRTEHRIKSAIHVQARYRGWLSHREYKRKVKAAITLQAHYRGQCDRRYVKYLRETKAMTTIQNRFRAFLAQQAFTHAMRAITSLQQYSRGRLGRAIANSRRQEVSAVTIQAAYRGHLQRRNFKQSMADIVLIQSCIRRRIAMKRFKQLKIDSKSVDKLQEKLKAAEEARKKTSEQLEEEVKTLKEERSNRAAGLKAEILGLKEANEALTLERDDLLEVGEALSAERDELVEELGRVKTQLEQTTAELNETKAEANETITELEAKAEEMARKAKSDRMVQMAQVETISGKFQWAEDNRLKVIADLEVRDADCATLSEKVRMLEAQRSSDAEVHAQAIATLESQLSDIRAFMTSMQQEVASSAPSADQVKTSEEYAELLRERDELQTEVRVMRGDITRLDEQLRVANDDARVRKGTTSEDLTEEIAQLNHQIATLTMRNELLESGAPDKDDADRSVQEEMDKKDLLIDELRRLVEEETGTDDVEDIIASQANTIAELRRQLRYALRDAIDAATETEQLHEEKEVLQGQIMKLLGRTNGQARPQQARSGTVQMQRNTRAGTVTGLSGFARAGSMRPSPQANGEMMRAGSSVRPVAGRSGFARSSSERRPPGRQMPPAGYQQHLQQPVDYGGPPPAKPPKPVRGGSMKAR